MTLIPYHTQFGTIDLANLTPGDVTAFAVADALAKTNRFGGRTPLPWSVASHSLLVERLCSHIDLKGWALLHDAHEAFIGDITSPALELICQAGTRSSIEHAIQNAKGKLDRAIGAAWECPTRSMSLEIRRADWVALQAETALFFKVQPETADPRDREDIERAFDLMHELPRGNDWVQAREAWIERAEALALMGLLRLPRPNHPDSMMLVG